MEEEEGDTTPVLQLPQPVKAPHDKRVVLTFKLTQFYGCRT